MRWGRAALVAVLLGGVALPGPVAAGGAPVAGGALARYQEAYRALVGGDFPRALAGLEGLPAGFVLADYAAFYAADARLRLDDEPAALERFRALPDRFPDSVLAPQALLAAMDTAYRLGRWPEVEREARRFLARAPTQTGAGRALVRLAEARAAQGFVSEAIDDLRRQWIDAPASNWGDAAREVMEELAGRHGLAIPPLTVEERLLLAQRLIEGGELTAGVRALEALLAEGPEPAERHRALLRLAPALARLQRGSEAIALLQAAVTEPATVWRPALLRELARLLVRTGQGDQAVPVLERILRDYPGASLTPDAWLALARLRRDLGSTAAAHATYQALLAAHPDGAAAASARWELAWLDYRGGRFRDAALGFRRLSAMTAGAASFRLAGRYWAARALDAAGQKPAAQTLYREILRLGPNTYYGLLAEPRLRSRQRPRAAAPPVRLAPDPLVALESAPHFQKARALASLGFDEPARAELETFGKDALVEPERAWSLGVAFAEVGDAARSLRYLRRVFGPAAEAGAPGLTPRFWRLYYPLGYADLIQDAAQRVGLDPFFVAAVIREESSYDPHARSWVGAMGLMQLMPDTARVVAAAAGTPLEEPVGLWEPPTNIALGARYLAQLRARFREPLLAVASYNAGPHRVDRWLAERGPVDLEEFVDQIPFDETRAFVKRVYTSWHEYRHLYGPSARPGRPGQAEAAPRRP